MRDTFLVTLMVIAAAALGGAGWTACRALRGEVDGCGALILGLILLGVGSSLLVAVGHAVGVTVMGSGS